MQERKKGIIELISRSDDNHGKLNDSTLHTVSSHFFCIDAQTIHIDHNKYSSLLQ